MEEGGRGRAGDFDGHGKAYLAEGTTGHQPPAALIPDGPVFENSW